MCVCVSLCSFLLVFLYVSSMHTSFQVLDLNDTQLQWVVGHLNHTTKVHMQDYRQMSGFIERTKIAKLMLIGDLNLAGQFKGKSIEDTQINGMSS